MPGFVRRRGGISLTVTLAVSISALVLVAVLAVLALGLWSGRQNTLSLLRDKAEFMVETTVGRIRSHLDPARHQVAFVERLIADGRVDPANRERFTDTLTGAMAAAPQITAVLFIDLDLQARGVARTPKGPQAITLDYSGDPRVREGMRLGRAAEAAVWGEPLWREGPRQTVLNLRQPVRRNGEFIGILVAAVSVQALSGYLAGIDTSLGSNVFILYDRDHVLAHPNLQSGVPGRSDDRPLPSLAETGDPVLAAIWQQRDRYPLEIIEGSDIEGHVLQLFNDEYIYIYRSIAGFGGRPWQVGSYFRAADVDTEFRRLMSAGFAGLGMLVLSILAAVWLGRHIARPVVRLADAASQIGALEISETAELPGSVFRELNNQAQAFNTMLRGLRWFEAYVPKTLVRRLISHGDAGSPVSVERELTVMFTDIAGFTRMSEDSPAAKIAEFLNHHFALVAGCIEDEDGTVDKFMGDGLMAFWGAPEEQPDHAARAARAALAIARAIEAENIERADTGEAPVRVRIGLHSGPVTVGNIGAPGRINYTIVGDAVNIGQRLEQLGREFGLEGSAVTVLASAATAGRLGDEFARESLGGHRLRGRSETIEVYRLG
jgi:class 3 adenylate cyclase